MLSDSCDPVQSVVHDDMHMLGIGAGSAHRISLLVVDGGGDGVNGVSSSSCSCVRIVGTLGVVVGVAGGVVCCRGWSVSEVVSVIVGGL